jgi:pimeloyl-ACP methyl ester carboxylesterase
MSQLESLSTWSPVEVQIPAGGALLSGLLTLPPHAPGIVVFAHGSGSSRFSVRNQFVAGVLNRAGFATLLFDLLTEAEEIEDRVTRRLRFDIELLADRLTGSVDWVRGRRDVGELTVGLFGASTGAAAALETAAQRPKSVSAVVSRGGRPDLARAWLPKVEAPTLLIVGERDPAVIEMNREARRLLRVECEIEIVPGATHLFEEPGTLEQVSRLAEDWFARYVGHNGQHTD